MVENYNNYYLSCNKVFKYSFSIFLIPDIYILLTEYECCLSLLTVLCIKCLSKSLSSFPLIWEWEIDKIRGTHVIQSFSLKNEA